MTMRGGMAAALLLLASWSMAAPPAPTALPPGAMYRYTDDQGRRVISPRPSPDAARYGYEIVSRQGVVLRTVPPAPTAAELAEREAEAEAAEARLEQTRRDAELRRLYALPDDAERARDRQITALQLSIDYARNTINQTRGRLDQETARAAQMERRGQAVPDATTKVIDRYSRQIGELERDIEQHEADIEKVRREYQPIIERLQVLVETP